jgi:hypothetical protein
MHYILEKPNSLDILDQYADELTFLGIIPYHDQYHPVLNRVSALYLGFKDSKESVIIPIEHSECWNYTLEEVKSYLIKFKRLFTLYKKESLYYLGNVKVYDLNLVSSLLEGSKIEVKVPVPVIDNFYKVHDNFYAVNCIIPIAKLHEKWEHIFNSVKRYMVMDLPEYFDFYNNKTIEVYYQLEKSGIAVTQEFFSHFQDTDPKYNSLDGRVYTWYNPYTATTRPSNTFNRINFAALNKESGIRGEVVSSEDYLVEFDYDGSHVRLLCDELDYKLTSEPAHQQIAKLYFPDQEITSELYEQSKKITFGAFYGTIPKKYEDLDIFKKLEKYLSKLSNTYDKFGYIQDSITNRPIYISGESPTIAKLLNYSIQSLEASRNVLVLGNLFKYLRGKRSKLVLYTYDAFLIDFSKKDGKETLEDIQRILSMENKYTVKFKYGKTLNFQ